jgi:hypothetical protein
MVFSSSGTAMLYRNLIIALFAASVGLYLRHPYFAGIRGLAVTVRDDAWLENFVSDPVNLHT